MGETPKHEPLPRDDAIEPATWTDDERETRLGEEATQPFACIVCGVPVDDRGCEDDPVMATCADHRVRSAVAPGTVRGLEGAS